MTYFLNKLKRLSIALLLLLSLPVVAVEQAGNDIAFLTVGLGARPTALGTAYTAMANDRHATYWNPAGLLMGSRREIGSMQTKLSSDLSVFYLAGKYQFRDGKWFL